MQLIIAAEPNSDWADGPQTEFLCIQMTPAYLQYLLDKLQIAGKLNKEDHTFSAIEYHTGNVTGLPWVRDDVDDEFRGSVQEYFVEEGGDWSGYLVEDGFAFPYDECDIEGARVQISKAGIQWYARDKDTDCEVWTPCVPFSHIMNWARRDPFK